jgi:C-terminal processing protease CtpA/Prc
LSGIKGWIIDLRENTGGNMEPMIAGLGPLFSSAKLGSLIDVNGRANSWYYKQGRYYWDDDPGWRVMNPTNLGTTLPIAVLIGNQTGSSGEAVAISFLRNAKTRTFGCPTWGLTTGNSDFKLRDGAALYLASTIMADRDGKSYRGSITPDVLVEGCVDKDVRAEAIKWLNGQ